MLHEDAKGPVSKKIICFNLVLGMLIGFAPEAKCQMLLSWHQSSSFQGLGVFETTGGFVMGKTRQ